jgi:hypothetical protein
MWRWLPQQFSWLPTLIADADWEASGHTVSFQIGPFVVELFMGRKA